MRKGRRGETPRPWRKRAGGAKALSDVLGSLLQKSETGRQVAIEQCRAAWRKAVGQEIASQTRVVAFSRKVLTVEVDTAPLLAELNTFYREELLASLRAEPGPLGGVLRLRFRPKGRSKGS